jgi:hypothetical protein
MRFYYTNDILFAPSLDKNNSYNFLVFDQKNKKYITINSTGYVILKIISSNPGISHGMLIKEIHRKVNRPWTQLKGEINIFIQQMEQSSIIYHKNEN